MTEKIEVAVSIRCSAWKAAVPEASRLARRSAAAAFAAGPHPRAPGARAEAAVVLADDAFVRDLNRRYRGRDTATNVLSFALLESSAPAAPEGEAEPLGDVVIAFETARAEANREGKALSHHLSHLVVHGMLHLLGHDHVAAAEAERMELLERRVLAALGVADPHRAGAGMDHA